MGRPIFIEANLSRQLHGGSNAGRRGFLNGDSGGLNLRITQFHLAFLLGKGEEIGGICHPRRDGRVEDMGLLNRHDALQIVLFHGEGDFLLVPTGPSERNGNLGGAGRYRLALLEEPDPEAGFAAFFCQQDFEAEAVFGKKLPAVRAGLWPLFMMFGIAVLLGVFMAIGCLPAMVLGIGVSL